MTEAKFYDVDGIEVFDVGTWNGYEYTDADLNEMVANFHLLKAAGYDFPAKLGHGQEQGLVQNSELPAVGYVKRLYRSGTKLVADFTRIPEKFKTCLELGAYRTVSAEIFFTVQLLGKTWKNVLSAVAFLGGDIPAVGTLDDVIALYHKPTAPQYVVFSEGAERRIANYPKEGSMSAPRTQPSARGAIREAIAKLRGLFNGTSFDEKRELVSGAVRAKWAEGIDGYGPWISEMFADHVIVSRDGKDWSVPYSIAEDRTVTLGDAVEVVQTWTPITSSQAKPTGQPGEEEEADMATNKAVLTALGLPDDATDEQIVAAANALKSDKAELAAQLATLTGDIATLKATNAQRTAKELVDAAIIAKKVLPADRAAMEIFAAEAPAAFKAHIEAKTEVLDTSTRGSEADAPEPESEVAQFRAKVAEKVKADTRAVDNGQKIADAQRAVAAEEPQLFAAVYGRR